MAPLELTGGAGPRPLRLLIVDDQDGFRQMLERMLGLDRRIDVVGTAADGAEAIEQAADLQPDVILMDIAMPVLDGFEATRTIRQANPRIAVLMLTGSSAATDVEQARAAGASGYVTKSMLNDLADAVLEAGRAVRR